MQKTLRKSVSFLGRGLHKGTNVKMTVKPAPVDTGIVFHYRDDSGAFAAIDAKFDNVTNTELSTRIGEVYEISTIEHLMAAFAGLGISNAIIEINAGEVPVFDGSSIAFVEKFWAAGFVEQGKRQMVYEVVAPVRFVLDTGAYAELAPHNGFQMSYTIDFPDQLIGVQDYSLDLANGAFIRELADCRTFALKAQVDAMKKRGLAVGGSLDNAVVIENGNVLNAGGLRRDNEAVRHKMLDAVGDLYLIGGPLIGHYIGYKSGHHLTNALLRKAVDQGAILARPVRDDELYNLPGSDLSTEDFRLSA